jgi:DNA-binding response OmpR family regulator
MGEPPVDRKRARVLVIEDDPGILEAIAFVLKHEGYTLLIARDGTTGLEMARKEQPDLVLSDLMLPGMNGYEICSMLKQDVRYKHIPVLIWSASKVETKDAQIAMECGADLFVLKTIRPKELLEKVRGILERPAP